MEYLPIRLSSVTMNNDIRRVGDAGIHTVEGNLAGLRAAHFAKERDKERQLYETKKAQIRAENSTISDINTKFSSGSDHIDDEFRRKTVGLVSAHRFRELRETVELNKDPSKTKNLDQPEEGNSKRKKPSSLLSFNEDVEDELAPRKRIGKDPTANTSFLADKDRDERLRQETASRDADHAQRSFVEMKEDFELNYSYWDGSGLRKKVTIKKGSSVETIMSACRLQLLHEVPELRAVSPSSLLLVVQGKIIPHALPLLDILSARSPGDSRVPMLTLGRHNAGDDHPIRVVERRWLDRNKHIYPYSIWEQLDPSSLK